MSGDRPVAHNADIALTPAGHHPHAYEVIRQALIRSYVPEHDAGQNASHLFAYIHDAGLRLVPARLDGLEDGHG